MVTILLIIMYISIMNNLGKRLQNLGKRLQKDHTKTLVNDTRDIPIPVDVPICSNISDGAKLALFDYYVYYYRVEHLMM